MKYNLLISLFIFTLLACNSGAIFSEKKAKERSAEIKEACGMGCGFPTDVEELKKVLSAEQFKITQENGTEKAFDNEYWDNKKPGIYVDVVSGDTFFLDAQIRF